MKALKDRILKDGYVLNGEVLKVDSFLNHQIDVSLLSKLADEWYERFKDDGITKIMTIESSGIALGTLVAQRFGATLVYAKKRQSVNIGADVYKSTVTSFTHGQKYDVFVSKRFISENDRILIVDDFLAYGSALCALIDICKAAGACVVGAGIAIEKLANGGRKKCENRGVRVESLAKIKKISANEIVFE